MDSGDAKAVHVIHTNAGYYGENSRVGHVDFCVNGGKRQPYCATTSSKSIEQFKSNKDRKHFFIANLYVDNSQLQNYNF